MQQNQVTNSYLSTIPFRDNIKKRLGELWNYPRMGTPEKRGPFYYFFKNNGLQNQSVVYRQKGINGIPEVFFDPNKLSADGTVALSDWSYSKNAKYVAYTIAMSGSDWQEAYILDIKSKEQLPDKIRGLNSVNSAGKEMKVFIIAVIRSLKKKTSLLNKTSFTRFGIINWAPCKQMMF